MIFPYRTLKPKIHPTAFVAPGAHVIGDVTLAKGSSVWFTAVLRGDMGAIRVGVDSNVQDGCVLHGDHGKGATLGKGVIMGHQATAHACTVGDYVLIGIGARVLTGARVGAFSLIGAGAVVRENAVIPPRSLVLGVPGKVVRRLTAAEARHHVDQARRYREYAARYREALG
ncbi:MAG TPA: gamma carbonic anhydrase family protein [Candidatus Eisenbacteria bacterium]|jgi:carbonic anhydrase/acetyltransferase-like protein (isoleucine patch superfamily)|nr:gamma carbonic anhydrase family protein [Candidatus Eisenbacteria bacterium]